MNFVRKCVKIADSFGSLIYINSLKREIVAAGLKNISAGSEREPKCRFWGFGFTKMQVLVNLQVKKCLLGSLLSYSAPLETSSACSFWIPGS